MTDEEYYSQFVCSCGSNHRWDHDDSCTLELCPEFQAGKADWDQELRRLVDLDEIFFDPDDWEIGTASQDALPLGTAVVTDKPAVSAPAGVTPYYYGGATAWVEKCRHYQQEVILSDGTVIYASSSVAQQRQDDPIPDLGIYLDGQWKPDTIAFHIGCPDYGVPKPQPWQVLHIATEAIRCAREGQRVEVGCIGGHGRTGMMLAIINLLAMEKPDGAKSVEYIRKNYCSHAVESKDQEWYVKGMACEIQGKVWPEKPKPPPPPPKPVFQTPAPIPLGAAPWPSTQAVKSVVPKTDPQPGPTPANQKWLKSLMKKGD